MQEAPRTAYLPSAGLGHSHSGRSILSGAFLSSGWALNGLAFETNMHAGPAATGTEAAKANEESWQNCRNGRMDPPVVVLLDRT